MIKKSEAIIYSSEKVHAELETLERHIDHEITSKYVSDSPMQSIGVDITEFSNEAQRIAELSYAKNGWHTKIETHHDGTFMYLS